MMVKQMIRKLRSRSGESLMESLLAILIFTLASIAMYSMVTVSADINLTVKEQEEIYEAQMLIAEQAETATEEGTIQMTVTFDGASTVTTANVEVYVYGAEGELFSYFAK